MDYQKFKRNCANNSSYPMKQAVQVRSQCSISSELPSSETSYSACWKYKNLHILICISTLHTRHATFIPFLFGRYCARQVAGNITYSDITIYFYATATPHIQPLLDKLQRNVAQWQLVVVVVSCNAIDSAAAR